jgi:hypothetical protein
MQMWLAKTLEKLMVGTFLSLGREIIWPFFGAFWLDAASREPEQFRTGESYTRRTIRELSDTRSVDGVKQYAALREIALPAACWTPA